jgi:hypothetical protein
MVIPLRTYIHAMGCKPNEGMTAYLNHALTGLHKESLIDEFVKWGNKTELNIDLGLHPDASGVLAAPSPLGIELFMWSYGVREQPNHQFFFKFNSFPIVEGVELDLDKVIKFPAAKDWGSDECSSGTALSPATDVWKG